MKMTTLHLNAPARTVALCTALWVVVHAVPMAGCSSSSKENPNWPERFPVTGTVTYKGEPIEAAEVTFMSKSKNSAAAGRTDSDGHFYLTTFVEKDGAVAGPQVVSIRRVDIVDMTPEGVEVAFGGTAFPPADTSTPSGVMSTASTRRMETTCGPATAPSFSTNVVK